MSWACASVDNDTYENGDEELKEPDRAAAKRITEREEEQNVGGGQEHARPQGQCWEQHTERDGRTQELGEVGADDGDLGERI